MLIPQTDRRPIRFQMPTFVPRLVGLLLLSATAAALFLGHAKQLLEQDIASLSELETVNLDQRRQIEAITSTMKEKVRETDALLDRLRVLEAEIEQLLTADDEAVAEGLPPQDRAVVSASTGGRGGGVPVADTSHQPMMLANALSEVSLLGARRTAEQTSRGSADRTGSLAFEQAYATQELMDAQFAEADLRMRSLIASKAALVNLREYQAHRPTGMPVEGELSDTFGQRWSPFGWGRQYHYGIDIAANAWEPITTTGDGVVVFAGWQDGGYGYTVIIDHGYGFHTLYAHMIDYDVTMGDEVSRGQVIGYVGSTGLSTGPHLHYEVHVNGVEVDPMKYVQ